MVIDHPGVYAIPAATYHADPCPVPSLSASIAKKLCLASPLHAHHDHPRLNPAAVPDEADHFDRGTAAHAVLLEGGGDVVMVDAPDWRTKAAQAARQAARESGKTALLTKDVAEVIAMVGALRGQLDRHVDGGAAMFTAGEPEQTIVWIEDGDLWCRARVDWLRTDPYAIDDYKTTSASANPDQWARTMFAAGHDLQAAFYLRGLRAITGERLDDPAAFRFAVQETFPPYAASVIALNPDAMLLAEKKVLYALEAWRTARASGDWFGYPRRTAYATLPAWHEAWWLEKELQ
jgi:hypothetical protein